MYQTSTMLLHRCLDDFVYVRKVQKKGSKKKKLPKLYRSCATATLDLLDPLLPLYRTTSKAATMFAKRG